MTEFRANGKWGGTVAHHPGLTPNRPKENTAHQTSHDPCKHTYTQILTNYFFHFILALNR